MKTLLAPLALAAAALTPAASALPIAPQGTAFGWARIDMARTPISFDVDDAVATWNEMPASMPLALYGIDFDADANVLHAISWGVSSYGTIDQTTGAFTLTGDSNLPHNSCYGLTAHPDGVTWYAIVVDNAAGTTQLWKTTTTFEAFAPVGPPNPLRIWTLACRADGALFGMSVVTNALYEFDPATGATTLVGPLGFDSNFVQDMDYDWSTGKLMATLCGSSGVWLADINDATGFAALGEDLTPLTNQASIAIKSPRPAVIEETCPALDNITGVPTKLKGQMSSPVGSGLHLEGTFGPPAALGIVVFSSGLDATGVLISNGRMCISLAPGESSGRYILPGTEFHSVGAFDAGGVFVNASGTSTVGTGFDVPAVAPTLGSPALAYGTTWHFQLWHRDGFGASNFSNAVSVTF